MYARSIPAPAVHPTTQRRWVLTLGMLVALLQSSVFAIVDPDLSGWHPEHGHVSLSGAVGEHAHPWDHSHRESSTEVGEPAEVGFTGPTTVGSVAGLVIPGAALLTLGLPAVLLIAYVHSSRVPRGLVPDVLLPPPRS